jgi:NDP-sugar pyrophosphorylase family protein
MLSSVTNFSVILLAGGLGTRVRALYPDLPKPMIPSRGKPFLEWVLAYWRRQGAGHAVLSVGHLGEVIERHFAAAAEAGRGSRGDAAQRLEVVREPRAMGTGGAVVCASHAAHGLSDPFFVANGDSLVAADLGPALERLRDDSGVDGAVVGVEMADTSRYGSLAIGEGGRLAGFREKQPRHGWINAGVYLFRRSLLERFPDRVPLSMETEVFPALLAGGANLAVIPVEAPFLDMGTPEALGQLDDFVAAHCELSR